MHWLYLILAILSEVAGTTCMKLSAGFTKLVPSILMWVFYGVCFTFLSLTLRKLDVSVAYAIWSGLGTALIAVIGVAFFREPMGALKCFGLLAIIGGVVALNLSGGDALSAAGGGAASSALHPRRKGTTRRAS